MIWHTRFPLLLLALSLLSGCFALSHDRSYPGPAPRPEPLREYYSYERLATETPEETPIFTEKLVTERSEYSIWQITIETEYGPTVIDYYRRPEKSENLIFVFPVLGGRPIVSRHIAGFFAEEGFETAVVHRNNEFKDPNNFYRIEQVLREGVLRDRIALDFFEDVKGKKTFGSFGISRGAINVAITAGIDPRLRYNVMALGGTNLVGIFRDSRERRIKKFIRQVSEQEEISRQQLLSTLAEQLVTDPQNVSHYIDARDTLLFLAVCDMTVPYRYGEALRTQIGYPETVYLLATHRTAILNTQIVKLVPPSKDLCLFPFPYIETEALAFFRKRFYGLRFSWRLLPYRLLQLPGNLIAEGFDWLAARMTDREKKRSSYEVDIWTANPEPPTWPMPAPDEAPEADETAYAPSQ